MTEARFFNRLLPCSTSNFSKPTNSCWIAYYWPPLWDGLTGNMGDLVQLVFQAGKLRHRVQVTSSGHVAPQPAAGTDSSAVSWPSECPAYVFSPVFTDEGCRPHA